MRAELAASTRTSPRKLSDFLSAVELGLSPAESSAAQPIRLPLQKNIAASRLQLIGSLQPGAQHLKKVLAGYSSEHQDRPRSALMLVGPQGDFTPAELALARRHGRHQLRSARLSFE